MVKKQYFFKTNQQNKAGDLDWKERAIISSLEIHIAPEMVCFNTTTWPFPHHHHCHQTTACRARLDPAQQQSGNLEMISSSPSLIFSPLSSNCLVTNIKFNWKTKLFFINNLPNCNVHNIIVLSSFWRKLSSCSFASCPVSVLKWVRIWT